MAYHEFDVTFESKLNKFHSRKWIWKCRQQIVGHIIPSSMHRYIYQLTEYIFKKEIPMTGHELIYILRAMLCMATQGTTSCLHGDEVTIGSVGLVCQQSS